MKQFLEVGQIVNTFGLKGFLKVQPYTDDIKRFDRLETVYINKKKYQIEEVKYHKNMVLIKIKGIDKIEDAEMLRNLYIEVDRNDEPELEEGTYYIVDLIGLEVYTDENIFLGNVIDIFNTGSNDVYVVKNEDAKEILLPGIDDVIKNIDLENKRITVHMLKGLM